MRTHPPASWLSVALSSTQFLEYAVLAIIMNAVDAGECA